MSEFSPRYLRAPLCLGGELSLAGFNQRDTEDHRDRAKNLRYTLLVVLIFILSAFTSHAQTKITVDHNTGAAINPEFRFKSVPSPSRSDSATNARVMIVDGEADPNSAGVVA